MPNFKKSTGYKMKGYTYPGNSPAKISDQAVVDAQAKLDHVELDFKEPGWATAARGIHEGAKSVLSSFTGGDKKEGDPAADEEQAKGVQENVESLGDDGLSGMGS